MEKTPKVLIVDDQPFIRDILEGLLTTKGYKLSFAVNGREALQKVVEFVPDLILLDVMMPELNGFQVCQLIKTNEKWRHIPIILVTALDGKNDLVRGLDAGADDFLQKPFDNLELLARVRSMLRIKEQYDMLAEQRKQLETALRLNEQFARVTAQHLEELELLHDVGLRLMNNLDLDSVLSVIAQVALELVPDASRCIMHLLSENQRDLLPVVFSSDDYSKVVYPQVGFENIVYQVIEQRQAAYIPDLSQTQTALVFDDLLSLLIVPLIDEQQLIGTLSVLGAEIETFEDNQRHVLSILANQAMVAIMKARFFEERQRAKEREKYQLRHLFNRYVSSTVVDRLVEQGDQVALGGKRQEITVLFTDIRNFTRLSEKLHPEDLVEVLNQYLALAVTAILEQEGTLDKFMGDAVMAFFNAPLNQPDHVLRAVRAAWAMQQLIKQHHHQAKTADPFINFGTGLHLGPAVVGNIGTTQQMNYTAIGDTVNVAKRLQENAEGGQIIISQEVYDRVQPHVMVKDLGSITVKGRSAIVHIYELIGLI